MAQTIGEIDRATTEPTQGIARVSAALAVPGRMAPHNSVLVEQSAASAKELRQQAEDHRQTVSRFWLQVAAAA